MEAKVQLHVSMMDMMARCGVQFLRRYGARFGIWHEEEIIKPGIALVVGITVHKAVEKNLRSKLETGDLLNAGAISEIAYSAFDDKWMEGIMLTEEQALNSKKTRGAGADQAVALSLLHHIEFAPTVTPVAVEERFVIELEGFPMDLSGTKDIVEADKIGDVKTMAANKASVVSTQMAMYALDFKVKHGKYPAEVYHHKLIKTKTPKAVVETAVPDDTWINPLKRRVERCAEIIEAAQSGKEAMMPADPNHWACTAKYCGYARSCKFWSGRE